MKKGMKGLLVVSVGLLLTGCSCNDKNTDTPNIVENKYEPNYVYDDVSTNLTNLYKECVKSVVKITAGSQIGSGVVYKEEGNYAYILTNAHVVVDSLGNTPKNIDVLFHNYTEVKGMLVETDINEDVAVIMVNKSTDYKVANIIDKDDNVNIGDSIFTIGNPNDMPFSITTGIISANRYKTSTSYISGNSDTTTYVYNSTATINPGNSGGAVFNSDGKLVAINTMRPVATIKDPSTGKEHQYEPIDKRNHNYSIPVNHFIKVANYIVTHGTSYVRGNIKITVKSICDFSTNDIKDKEIAVKKGVIITESNESELPKNRIITHVNGVEIKTSQDYEFELLKYSKNDTVQVTTVDYLGNNSKNVNIKLK